MATPSSTAPFSPTKSMIASAPWPSVISSTVGTCDPSTLTVRSAPSSAASASARSLGSRTMISVGVIAFRHWTDVTEAAGADHHGPRPGAEHRQGLLDGVDGGQARVGERGDVGRAHRGVELDDRPRAGEQEVGEAAVAVDARERPPLAVHVVARAAAPAQPARDVRVHDDGVADLQVGDTGPDLAHPAGVLVPGRVGQPDLRLLGPLPLLDVQIGAAEPGRTDPHDDVERPGGPRLVALVEPQRLVVAVQPGRVHANCRAKAAAPASATCWSWSVAFVSAAEIARRASSSVMVSISPPGCVD